MVYEIMLKIQASTLMVLACIFRIIDEIEQIDEIEKIDGVEKIDGIEKMDGIEKIGGLLLV